MELPLTSVIFLAAQTLFSANPVYGIGDVLLKKPRNLPTRSKMLVMGIVMCAFVLLVVNFLIESNVLFAAACAVNLGLRAVELTMIAYFKKHSSHSSNLLQSDPSSTSLRTMCSVSP
eukprot:TRINITY_DN45378_c0_g1_i1.p4 TRINITY_DN45378_c0_g1~~TRINITY_DN45378_c0_g1_i1.p4  ORF type:complete len:117 (+),score=13.50 TRINITY_DN45378_c0_g1_i1:81-431(+)